jgi:hypothetical protein
VHTAFVDANPILGGRLNLESSSTWAELKELTMVYGKLCRGRDELSTARSFVDVL